MEKNDPTSSQTKLIIGLGNPGLQYSGTRHNLGRCLAEYIAGKHQLKFTTKKTLQASLVSFQWSNQAVLLSYPETYMNLSGEAVGALVRYHSIDPAQDLLVLVDDAAIELGRLRLRPGGSDGGHNGLKSIDQALGLNTYARLRLGIGPKQETGEAAGQESAFVPALERYVLEKFKKPEMDEMPRILDLGYEATQLWLTGPVEQAMNTVNSLK